MMLCTTKKINNLTIVLSEKKILNETKNHTPPFKSNGRSLSGEGPDVEEYDRAKVVETWFSREREILNFQTGL